MEESSHGFLGFPGYTGEGPQMLSAAGLPRIFSNMTWILLKTVCFSLGKQCGYPGSPESFTEKDMFLVPNTAEGKSDNTFVMNKCYTFSIQSSQNHRLVQLSDSYSLLIYFFLLEKPNFFLSFGQDSHNSTLPTKKLTNIVLQHFCIAHVYSMNEPYILYLLTKVTIRCIPCDSLPLAPSCSVSYEKWWG